jgi:LysR family glycine cleavage system transcriptional activator
MFAADLVPVCAPRLAARLKRVSDLSGPMLIRVTHARDDWPLWLKAAGAGRITAKGPAFAYYGQAIQAAADGVGVAMGIRPYIDDDLAAGRLVTPFALSVPKGQQWYLIYRDFRKDQRDFVAFRKWLLKTSRKSKP